MAPQFRAYLESDREAVFALFARAAEEHVEFEPPSPAAWRWAYGDGAEAARVFVTAEEGKVVAVVAGRAHRVWVKGGEHAFTHVGLLVVDPEREKALAKEGALVSTAKALLAAHGSRDTDLVYFGHADPRSWMLLRQRLASEVVRTESVLLCQADACEAEGEVVEIERFDEQMRWLYERCSGDWGASLVRDADTMNRRYVERPEVEYARLGVRDGEGILRGIAVARFVEEGGKRVLAVADWLVPPVETAVGEELFRGLLARARAANCSLVAAMLPDFSPWFDQFQRWGFQVHPTDHVLVTRHFDKRLDQMWLNEGWWVQPGDSLLV